MAADKEGGLSTRDVLILASRWAERVHTLGPRPGRAFVHQMAFREMVEYARRQQAADRAGGVQ